MSKNIALTAAVRANLLTLQQNQKLTAQTNRHLSTGLKVGSAVDDAVSFFTAKGLQDNADDFSLIKDGIDQGISAVTVALDAINSVTDLVQQMKGLAFKARGAATAERATLSQQFDTLRSQISDLLSDADYNGTNLIGQSPDSLIVDFDPDSNSTLTLTGIDLRPQGSNMTINAAVGSWATDANITSAVTEVDAALSTLRSQAATFGSNIAIMKVRIEFTSSYVSTMEEGAGKLTLADMNEESANLLALQTRQQLGLNSLSLATQSEQAILNLF